ncbi:MAG: DUF2752 domain-containing protein [Duncaniella sp.]|uniref:DUF2752 domain-containing protein n=1 Tax=Duncaniella sp. TaxID=2518496 RepID=UPI0023D16D00|nr:DUF2752 domain-containing protein [Duncaniella sp.]MDE6090873.1 DUF2752 domain-containing protein [Duncaniella sp.]
MIREPFCASNRQLLLIIAVIIAAGLLALYFFAEPSSGLYPRCAFKMLTGLSCPGCGSQRAVHALLHGDLGSAFAYNALFIIEIPLIGLLLLSRIPRLRGSRLQRILSARVFILSILFTIIIWTIVRNIFDV